MKTKRNNRRNKNKTCRRGGAVFDMPKMLKKSPVVKMPRRAAGKLTIYIEPYVKELNTSGYDKYECYPSFAPENCVSNTDNNTTTFEQSLVKDYMKNYNNLITISNEAASKKRAADGDHVDAVYAAFDANKRLENAKETKEKRQKQLNEANKENTALLERDIEALEREIEDEQRDYDEVKLAEKKTAARNAAAAVDDAARMAVRMNFKDRYISDDNVIFNSPNIITPLNTNNKASNITNLWEPYFNKLKDHYKEADVDKQHDFQASQDDFQASQCNINKSYNVVVSSHQHLIDKLLKWKSPKDLLQPDLGIKKNDDKPATSPDDLKYMHKGLIYGEKKMGMRNGMIIMFEFTPKKCKWNGCSSIKKDIKDARCIDLTIKAFCEPGEKKKGKNKYLYPPTEKEDLIDYFDKDYITKVITRLNELFDKIIDSDINKKKLPRNYRLYLIRHKYSIHNKNESQPEVTVPCKPVIKDKEKDKEIKVLNSPLAFNSTVQTEDDILNIYKLKSSDHNIFISSPLNRAIETLILFLNNNSNWEGKNPYENKLNGILRKFKILLQKRCENDILKKSEMTKWQLMNTKCGKWRETPDVEADEVLAHGGKRIHKTRKRKHKRKTRRRKNKKRKSRRRSIRRR